MRVVVLPHVSGCARVGVIGVGVAPWRVAQPEVATIRVLVDVDDKRCTARCRARVIVATCNTHTRVHPLAAVCPQQLVQTVQVINVDVITYTHIACGKGAAMCQC